MVEDTVDSGAASESGSDSSDSEDAAEPEVLQNDQQLSDLFLLNIRSGIFRALVPCEETDKGGLALEVSDVSSWHCTACGKNPSLRKVSFKRPEYLEPCRMKNCRTYLG